MREAGYTSTSWFTPGFANSTWNVIVEIWLLLTEPKFQVSVWPLIVVGGGIAEPITYVTPVGKTSVITASCVIVFFSTLAIEIKIPLSCVVVGES